MLKKLFAGLKKTREAIAAGIGRVLALGRSVDRSYLEELEETLLLADIGPVTVSSLVEELRARWKEGEITTSDEVEPFLRRELVRRLSEGDRGVHQADAPPTVILVAGVNGAGKTTSIAKLARHFQGQGKSVLLGAADTFRAAATEQLTVWAQRLGADIVKHKHGADPAAVAYDAAAAARARKRDILLVDTAGRLHTQEHLMKELEKIRRVVAKQIPGAPHEVLLVLDANFGQNAITQSEIFSQAIDVTGIVLAKLDGSARGGAAVEIQRRFGIPIKFVGLGETLEDLAPFDPEQFVEGLLSRASSAPAAPAGE